MERIPILKMGSFLLVTIQVDMHDQLALALQDDLTSRIVSDRASGVLIDISALDIVDSFIGRMLGNIASGLANVSPHGAKHRCPNYSGSALASIRRDGGRRSGLSEPGQCVGSSLGELPAAI